MKNVIPPTTLFVALLLLAILARMGLLAGPAFAETKGACSSTDLVFVLDNTYSLGGALWDMKQGLEEILDLVDEVSEGNYRTGLVTFKDDITIHMDFAQWDTYPQEDARDALHDIIESLGARGGNSGPEASDEALNTVINLLAAGNRRQNQDFLGPWQSRTRIAILITDNLPGGFDDRYHFKLDDKVAEQVALDASLKQIRISAIYVPTVANLNGRNPEVERIMRRYATMSGGIYSLTDRSGRGTARAITDIIRSCGEVQLW